jgi:hypothetical protein
MEQYRMAPNEIGQVLNTQGAGQCPWCGIRPGPMVVGEFGVVWQCGHARRLPPLHPSEKTTRLCQICSPEVAISVAARGLLRAVA